MTFNWVLANFQIDLYEQRVPPHLFSISFGSARWFLPRVTTRKLSDTQWSRNVKYWVEGKLLQCRWANPIKCPSAVWVTHPVSGLGRNLQTGMMARARCRPSLKRSVSWKTRVLELVKIDSETLSLRVFLRVYLCLSLVPWQAKAWKSLSASRDWDVQTLCFSLHLILFFCFSTLPARQQWLWRWTVTPRLIRFLTETTFFTFPFIWKKENIYALWVGERQGVTVRSSHGVRKNLVATLCRLVFDICVALCLFCLWKGYS
jgi:hypothetical protein